MSLQPWERGPPTLTRGPLESGAELRGLCAEFLFCCPGFQHDRPSPALGFLHVPLLPGAPLGGAPAALGLLLVEVVSARLYPSHGTIDVRRVYAPRLFVSSQQIFAVTDIKAIENIASYFLVRWKLEPLFIQFSSVAQSCLTLCDPMDCSTPGLPVHYQLPEFAETRDHAIQPSHPLSSPSPPTFNLSQHQGLFSSSHQVARVLEFQLQHWSFQ